MLSRVYDDLGYPTDERIDTISGESVYDLPMPRPYRWECAVCGLESTDDPEWSWGRTLCERCSNQSHEDARAAFSAWWNRPDSERPAERPNYSDRRSEESQR